MPDPNPNPAPNPNPDPNPNPNPNPDPNPAPWHGQTDAEVAAYIQNKGWKDWNGVLGSYRAAEKMIGRNPEDLIARPQDGDAAGWAKTYDRLGRPASPDKYDLKGGMPDGAQVDEQFMKTMADMFHKHGLTASQAKALATDFNIYQTKQAQAADDDKRTNFAAEKLALQQEWGGGYERMKNAASTAVKALGFTAAEVDALEGVIGFKGIMQKFAALGQKLADPTFVSPDGGARFDDTMTPAEAKVEIEKLKLDKDFGSALRGGAMHPASKAAKQKWSELHRIAYGDEPVR